MHRDNDQIAIDVSLQVLDHAATIFIEKCRTNGFIASKPNGPESVFSTFAAVELSHNLSSINKNRNGNMSESERLIQRNKRGIENTVLKCISNRQEDHEHLGCGFGYNIGDRPCLSASHYGLRILSFLPRNKKDERQRLRDFFYQNQEVCSIDDFIKFIRFCWNPVDGGFSVRPFEEPDILHTRYALQIFRTLLHNELINNLDDWFNASSILSYVLSCINMGGFSIQPGFVPLLSTTRAGVNCIKLLEILRIRGCFTAGHDYFELLRKFENNFRDIPVFIQQCNLDSSYYDHPINLMTK